jgi:branched-chain amino acid transport system substrate-binding protein
MSHRTRRPPGGNSRSRAFGLVIALLCATFALIAAGCGSSSDGSASTSSGSTEAASTTGGSSTTSADTSKPFKITALLPLTGPVSSLAKDFKTGIESSADVINQNGGILGRQVEVTFLDDAASPTTATQVMQKALNSGDKPDFAFSGMLSTSVLAVLPALTKAGVASCGTATSGEVNNPKAYPYSFAVTDPVGDQDTVVLQKLKDLGYSKLGLITVNDATGQATIKGVEQAAKDLGMTVESKAFAPNSVDASPDLDAIRSSNPQALLVMGMAGPSIATALKARTKLGWDIPMFAESGAVYSNMSSLVSPKELNGYYYQPYSSFVYSDPADRTAGQQQFLDALTKARGDKIALGTVPSAVEGYDCIQLAKFLVDTAGSTDPAAIQKAGESLAIPQADADKAFAFRSNYTFSPESHFPKLDPSNFSLVPYTEKSTDGLIQPESSFELPKPTS